MTEMKAPSPDEIFSVDGSDEFERVALSIFRLQSQQCPEYRNYLDLMGIDPQSVSSLLSIPFMPVSFFRDHRIFTGTGEAERVFLSSGTTGVQRSSHAVRDLGIYNTSLETGFRHSYGDPAQYAIMGLLPSYLEREDSSLVYMVKRLIDLSGNDAGGFFLHDHGALLESAARAADSGLKVFLIGVTFALLDLAESRRYDFGDAIIMETGGMKGRRMEMIREEVHQILKVAFGQEHIHSEYGMTEMLSQAYSRGEGIFEAPPWMRVLIRDSHDPLSHTDEPGASGGISVVDLANIWSCSFIATSDLGRMLDKGRFEVLGRFDDADIRGCSLMVS